MSHVPFGEAGESAEHAEQLLKDALLSEDWHARFQTNGASVRALNEAIQGEPDPLKAAELVVQKGESLIRALGSGTLSLWKDDELAERATFEAEFGPELPE